MNNLTFNFQNHPIRFVGTAENPEWIAADACKALELKSKPSNIIRRFSDLERGVYLTHTPGVKQRLLTVKEPGLYKLIFKSESKKAAEFQDWLAHEVLPAIRKQGYYGNAPIPEPPTQIHTPTQIELPLEKPPATGIPEITAIAEMMKMLLGSAGLSRRVIALATAEAIGRTYPELAATMSTAQKYLKP